MIKRIFIIGIAWIIAIIGIQAQQVVRYASVDDPALVPPVINTHPSKKYNAKNLDYGMTIGIERTPKGRIWACWVGGGDDSKAFFVLAYSDNDGEKWSKTKVVIDPHDKNLEENRRTIVGNLWTDPKGRLWLFFDQAMTYYDGRGGMWYTICENPDDKLPVWSAPIRFCNGFALNKPTILPNGSWMLPVSLWNRQVIDIILDKSRRRNIYHDSYHELDSLRGAQVYLTQDEGKTWKFQGMVKFPKPRHDEHHVTVLKDGSLWMTCRTMDGIWQSFSQDEGKTWSVPTKYLEHVNSRHFIRRLSSGKLLLVKHGKPNENTLKRSHLAAYLSDDDGRSWKGGLMLDERTGVSYPDGFEAPDHSIYISYDHNRSKDGEILMARFTEQDILAGKIISPKGRLQMIISKPGKIKKGYRMRETARKNKQK